MTTRVALDDTGKASLPVAGDRVPHAVVDGADGAFHGGYDQELPLARLEGLVCDAIRQAGFASDPFQFVGASPRFHSRHAPGSCSNRRLAPEDEGP